MRKRGGISFAEFMDAALYDPAGGFYVRGARLGPRGAFWTAPTHHRAFAEAVRAELVAAHESLGRPSAFTVVEVGPGDGTLATALAPTLARLGAELVLVERAAGMRAAQREALASADVPVSWVESPADVRAANGFVVANEVFDDLACHLLEWPDEVVVELDERGRFVEARAPAAPELRALVAESGAVPAAGGRYAVRPAAPGFLGELAAMIAAGRLLVADYGGEGPAVHRGVAPVRTYIGGRPGGDPLSAPGTQNITADVDFGALRHAASALGLDELRYEPQPAWLRGHGGDVPPAARRGRDDWALARAIESLDAFRVLLLERRR